MSHAKPNRSVARILTLLLSSCLLSIAGPAAAQAHSARHIHPAAGHTAPYTRVVKTGGV